MIAELSHLPPIAGAVIGFLVGVTLGLVHFSSLRRVTVLYLAGRDIGRALALQAARFANVLAVLVLLARVGVLPLLAGTLGLLVGRALVLRQARKVP
ncbi:ATP synthase subunit I [Tropicimonas isoalkanivorans]|uniref:N-ATPase, AtpR subunit n=1 Tax=Tropicimonas isoalkanivorans TaxID=441112 RepID=A0A1I1L2G1_9RHOB|nr:ATP synthase subunit I [Tropicimonas isoalkanivorans]SFC67181.1 N-ATPase, AtpR subunit [Tropicimonas isoalkanivorans]